MYFLCCVHFCSFHAVTFLGQGLSVTKAAEVAMAPIAKAFPTFSGALIVADALGNMVSSQSLSTSFILVYNFSVIWWKAMDRQVFI